MRKLFLVLAGLFCFAPVIFASSVCAQEKNSDSRWMVGGYTGVLADQKFALILATPWTVRFDQSYIAALNATFVAYEFETLPVNIEFDAIFAKRFGAAHEWEIGFAPMLRWKSFPWNHIVYTNFRFGLVGASLTSGVSDFEVRTSANNRGSRFLNLMVPEITFSSGPNANWEVFVRVHHRSGGYGLINGVSGGSNYIGSGFRVRL